jgi:hypothetical protein
MAWHLGESSGEGTVNKVRKKTLPHSQLILHDLEQSLPKSGSLVPKSALN